MLDKRYLWSIPLFVVFGSAFSVCIAQTQTPPLRSQSTVVLVPTLVKTQAGEIVYGLSARDFMIEDEGQEQSVQLDDSPDSDPASVVVAIQRGRSAALHLETPQFHAGNADAEYPSSKPTLSGLGTMLEYYVGESKGAVAVVAFDSRVQLFQDFTEDMPAVSARLKALSFGDDGAAILDALSYSMGLLDRRPAGGSRVVILIGETRDHGSRTKFESIAQRAGVTNTLVYGLSFSPVRAEVVRDLKTEKASPSAPANLLAPIMMAFNAFRKNVAIDVAKLSGGEYLTFGNQGTFDTQMATLANDDRSRYLLSFQPSDPKPGRHAIKVRLRNPERFVVTARSMYWAVGRQGTTGTEPNQGVR